MDNGNIQYVQYINAIDMLIDRGVSTESITRMTVTEYNAILRRGDNVEIRGESDTASYLVLFRDSIKKDNIVKIIDSIKGEIETRLDEGNEKKIHVILSTNDSLPHLTKAMVHSINVSPEDKYEEYMHFQHIFNSFLNLNPTLNELVPKHILLSDEEGIEELKQLKLQPSQLPKIKIDNFDRDPTMVDAQARW